MTPDDPRHGTNAGYLAHRDAGQAPCDRCKAGRYRDQKRLRYARANGVQLTYTADEIRTVIQPWLDLGLAPSAITVAAGLETQRGGCLARLLREGGEVRRGTYHALAAITEDDFAPEAKVYADLTRTRVYSLMAIGHRLDTMPINPRGQWRYREHVTVATARAVRDHYTAHEFTIGDFLPTATRARNGGHKPPLAWDDPGTLAWPAGRRPRTKKAPVRVYDEAVVERILSGEWGLRANTDERLAVLDAWLARGGTQNELERRTGWNVSRMLRTRAA